LKPRLLIILVLIVLLPLVILGWLGVRVARNEREIMRHRLRDLVVAKLRYIDADIAEVLTQRERELLSQPAPSSYPLENLRELGRKSGVVRQYFVLDSDDRLVYPCSPDVVLQYFPLDDGKDRPGVARQYLVVPSDGASAPSPSTAQQRPLVRNADGELVPSPLGALTDGERAFLERTKLIWANREIPNVAEETAPAPPQAISQRMARPATSAKGWYAWYWGDDVHLIFWWRDASGQVVGAELNEVRLKADVVGALPDTDPWDPAGADARFVLRDSVGGVIYQWGGYEAGDEETAQAGIALTPPLSAWRLECYGPDALAATGFGRSAWFNVLSGLALLGATVIALAVYYYRESARDLREASQRISFVNQVSHELKTPLTNIRMYAEMLDRDLDEADETPRRRLEVIVSESQRLSRLIGNVLTFSRKQRSALRLHAARGNVDEVVRQVLDHFEAPLRAKGVELQFAAGAGREAEFDRDALEQIVGNLLNNVEKYAASATRVDVATTQQGDRVSVTVADDGPGVPSADRARIFQPFYRVSNKLTDGVAGTGIGLAIARDLAQLHGGELTLEPSDRGACFRLVFRAPQTDPGEPA